MKLLTLILGSALAIAFGTVVAPSMLTTLRINKLVDEATELAGQFDYTSAIQHMDEAIEIAPENAELYAKRGEFVMLIYEWDRSLANYDHALALDPEFAEAYYLRGILYYTMAERSLAEDDFFTYLTLEPEGEFARIVEDYLQNIETELDTLGG